MRYRRLITHAQSTPLSDDAVMALIAEAVKKS
jgi:hypothetical protein